MVITTYSATGCWQPKSKDDSGGGDWVVDNGELGVVIWLMSFGEAEFDLRKNESVNQFSP